MQHIALCMLTFVLPAAAASQTQQLTQHHHQHHHERDDQKQQLPKSLRRRTTSAHHHLVGYRKNIIKPSSGLRWRQLTTLATTKCDAIRQDTYLAELQLSYSYEAEFAAGHSRSLVGLKDALVDAVVEVLDDCDEEDRPVFQVRTNGIHQFSQVGTCVPTGQGNVCSVVDGTTLILLDSQSALAQQKAMSAIEAALADTSFLNQFTSSVARAKFLTLNRERLVVAPKNDGSGGADGGGGGDSDGGGGATLSSAATAILAASASVSFVVASIFCYGFMRREQRRSPIPSIRHRFASRRLTSNFITSPLGRQAVQQKRPFFPLDEGEPSHPLFPLEALPAARFDLASGHYVMDAPDEENGLENHDPRQRQQQQQKQSSSPRNGTTWSVSDLTSESGSILSALSRTTSKLARIEEADDEVESWDDGSSSYHSTRSRREHQAEDEDDDIECDDDDDEMPTSHYYRRTVELYDGEFRQQSKMETSAEMSDVESTEEATTSDDEIISENNNSNDDEEGAVILESVEVTIKETEIEPSPTQVIKHSASHVDNEQRVTRTRSADDVDSTGRKNKENKKHDGNDALAKAHPFQRVRSWPI